MVDATRVKVKASGDVVSIPQTGIAHAAVSMGALPVIIPVHYRWTPTVIALAEPANLRHVPPLSNSVICFAIDSLTDDGEACTLNVVGRTGAQADGELLLSVEEITNHPHQRP